MAAFASRPGRSARAAPALRPMMTTTSPSAEEPSSNGWAVGNERLSPVSISVYRMGQPPNIASFS